MYLGLDIGGTKIYAARYDARLRVKKEIVIPTENSKGRKQVLENICYAIRCTYEPETTESIGIAWAGFVDNKNGIIRKSPNIFGFEKFPLKRHLEKIFRKPVYMDNDAKLFTAAEHAIGKARKCRNVVGLIIGTGIGSGIMIDGTMLNGAHGYAGEVGHTLATAKPPMEFETVLQSKNNAQILNMSIQLLYNLMLTFDPEIIVIGGGVGNRILLPKASLIRQKIQYRLDEKEYPLKARIEFSGFINAGSMGAALMAREGGKIRFDKVKK